MRYDKLVRDKIPDIIRENNGKPVFHIANEDEYWQKLKEKLREEVEEFVEDSHEEELADILEVIDAIYEHKKIDQQKINSLRTKKAKEKGTFQKRIILEEVQ